MVQYMPEHYKEVSLLINADDLLLSKSIDEAIIELFAEGAISNTTAMMCLPHSEQRLGELKSTLDTSKIGVHLQLTSGTPLSRNAQSLTDKASGRFVSKNMLQGTLPKEVEDEWRAQIDLFYRTVGHPPSHLDSHHGSHRLGHLLPIYLKLAAEYGIPVRGGNIEFQSKISKSGICSTDFYIGDWTGQGLSCEYLVKQVIAHRSKLKPVSIEVAAHPSHFDVNLRNISSLNDARSNDFSELMRLPKLLESVNGVNLFGYEARR